MLNPDVCIIFGMRRFIPVMSFVVSLKERSANTPAREFRHCRAGPERVSDWLLPEAGKKKKNKVAPFVIARESGATGRSFSDRRAKPQSFCFHFKRISQIFKRSEADGESELKLFFFKKQINGYNIKTKSLLISASLLIWLHLEAFFFIFVLVIVLLFPHNTQHILNREFILLLPCCF